MKYLVQPFEGDAYEVDADRLVTDPSNTNRVTFYKDDVQVAQENSAQSARPVADEA